MARDYTEERLRSTQEATRIEKDGAYVSIPVETLERVRSLLWAGELTGDFETAVLLIQYELFPEDSSTDRTKSCRTEGTTNKQGQSRT